MKVLTRLRVFAFPAMSSSYSSVVMKKVLGGVPFFPSLLNAASLPQSKDTGVYKRFSRELHCRN